MLIKVTNKCSMGCSHCMEDSTVKGEHMTEDTFLKALAFTKLAETPAWSLGIPPLILLSGGECTEHPQIVRFVEHVLMRGYFPLLITNGSWLANKELREALLPRDSPIFVQVTNDARFYPTKVERYEDSRITYIDSLTHLIPLGRAARKKGLEDMGLPLKKYPGSFNMRSLARSYGSFELAIIQLRKRALRGQAGHCIPSITYEGDVLAGETRSCWKVGTVDSTMAEITDALLSMGTCNRCGLEDNLSVEEQRAIGVSPPSL